MGCPQSGYQNLGRFSPKVSLDFSERNGSVSVEKDFTESIWNALSLGDIRFVFKGFFNLQVSFNQYYILWFSSSRLII